MVILIRGVIAKQRPADMDFRKLWLNFGFSHAAPVKSACQPMWQKQGDINNILSFYPSVRPSVCRPLSASF